jgi:hypothetical protein
MLCHSFSNLFLWGFASLLVAYKMLLLHNTLQLPRSYQAPTTFVYFLIISTDFIRNIRK